MDIYLIENDLSETGKKLSGEELGRAPRGGDRGESDRRIQECFAQNMSKNDIFSPAPENPGAISVQRTAKGKPLLRDYPEIHLSVSHSGRIWACAFSRGPVGLDLEKIDPGIGERQTGKTEERYLRIARRFFSTEEFDYVKENGALGFYQIWVRKEAYGKYTGEGLFPSFKELDTVAEGALRQAIGNIKFEGIDLELVGYPGYEAVCCLPSESREEVRIHTWNEERQERWERQR